MTTEKHFPPVFATNRPDDGETVAAELVRLFQGMREDLGPVSVAIATAYLNPAGFVLLADELEQAPSVRLLLGAEPDPKVGQRTVPPLTNDETQSALEEHGEWLARERDLTGFSREEDRAARRTTSPRGGLGSRSQQVAVAYRQRWRCN